MKLTSEALAARWDFRVMDVDVINGLKELSRSLDPDPVVINLGAGYGISGLVFMESREDLNLITVDAHEVGLWELGLEYERKSMKEAGFLGDPRYEQIHGLSNDTGISWDRGQVDMVFVDASHSYEACKGDALAWMPHIKDGGIIAFHDYWHEWDYGVIEAVDEVMAGYERIVLVSCLIAFRIKGQT